MICPPVAAVMKDNVFPPHFIQVRQTRSAANLPLEQVSHSTNPSVLSPEPLPSLVRLQQM